jgi:hypothetical protein
MSYLQTPKKSIPPSHLLSAIRPRCEEKGIFASSVVVVTPRERKKKRLCASSLLGVLEGHVALAAVVAVKVVGHHDTGAALLIGALLSQTGDLAGGIVDLVVLEDPQLALLVLVGNALRGGVDLLLPLLATTAETKDQVEGRLLLDVVVRKSAAILELLAGEDQSLLIRGDTLLVLDLSLDILNSVTGLDVKSDRLAREGLDLQS